MAHHRRGNCRILPVARRRGASRRGVMGGRILPSPLPARGERSEFARSSRKFRERARLHESELGGRSSCPTQVRHAPSCPQGAGEERAARSRTQSHGRIWLGIAFLALASLLFASPAHAAETVIAGGVSSGSTNLWPIYIGIRKGFFQAADIKVDLVFAQSNASVIQQLAANSINISVGSGLVDPIRAVEKGAPIALVRIETQKPPYALLA